MVVGFSPVAVTSDIGPVSSKEFLDILENIECGFNLECVRDMIIACSQIHRTEISTHNTAQSFGHFGQMFECSFMN